MDIKCDLCDEIATVHFTQIINGEKHPSHLCDWCMANRSAQNKSSIHLPALLQALLGQNELAQTLCPCCGIGFMEFRGQGRLGCPQDYTAFRAGLMPLLKRIHTKTRHKGKHPKVGGWSGPATMQLLSLRRELNQAVLAENYEKAGGIKTQIRLIQDTLTRSSTGEPSRNES